MENELNLFIQKALEKGQTKKNIKKVLLKAGWKEQEIDKHLEKYLDIKFPIPVPKREIKLTSKEAFLLLLVFTTLYISAISLVTLFFQFIDYLFPEIIHNSNYFSKDAIRFSIASLIISFPSFLLVSWIKEKTFQNIIEKYNSKTNRWLTYITLFITSIIMIIDLITLVFNLLNGEISIRFIMKILVVLLISGSIFLYYFSILRKGEKGVYIQYKSKNKKYIISTLITIYLLSIIAGITIIGTPSYRRMEQLDQTRINDLRQISFTIDNYFMQNNKLPPDLETLKNDRLYTYININDPYTQKPYEYIIESNDKYKLCANFSTNKLNTNNNKNSIMPAQDRFWGHPKGRKCFQITANKRRY